MGYGLISKFVTSGYIYGGQIIGAEIFSDNYVPNVSGEYHNLRNGDFQLAGGKFLFNSETNELKLQDVTIDWTTSSNPSVDTVEGMADYQEYVNELLQKTSETITELDSELYETLKKYVSNNDYEGFLKEIELKMGNLSTNLGDTYDNLKALIDANNSIVNDRLKNIETHFKFDVDGISIGNTQSPYEILLSYDKFVMYANGKSVLWIDATTEKAYIPNLIIDETFVLLGFEIKKEDNNINCDYIGGDD